MEKLKIEKIDNYVYTLRNERNRKIYIFQMKFFDLEQPLMVGDYILMHAQLLDPEYKEYSTEYYFGGLDQPYGRKIESKDHPDLIGIKTQTNEMCLKRFFG